MPSRTKSIHSGLRQGTHGASRRRCGRPSGSGNSHYDQFAAVVTSAPAPDVGRRKEIMLVAGEASGDGYGAQLVRAMHQRDPSVNFFGVAGEQLEQTPFEPLWSVSKLTGMGLGSCRKSGNIWRCYRLLRRSLKERRPNLLVLIDFPILIFGLPRLPGVSVSPSCIMSARRSGRGAVGASSNT